MFVTVAVLCLCSTVYILCSFIAIAELCIINREFTFYEFRFFFKFTFLANFKMPLNEENKAGLLAYIVFVSFVNFIS